LPYLEESTCRCLTKQNQKNYLRITLDFI
jgi:hypothetical protein